MTVAVLPLLLAANGGADVWDELHPLPEQQRLGSRDGLPEPEQVHEQLRRVPGAGTTHVHDAPSHRLQHGTDPRQRVPVPADEQLERPVPSRLDTPAHGCVENGDPSPDRPRTDLVDNRW